MLNTVTIVGRLIVDPTIEEGKGIITIAVPRPFKNEEGEFDTDNIECRVYKNILNQTKEYCRKGDIVGIKGRIEADTKYDEEKNIISNSIYIVVERLTFLSSRHESE